VFEVVQQNAASVAADADLVISVFATAGVADSPTLCVATFPIPAADYADAYERGIALAVPPTMAMSADVISPHIKTRNRLHWHISDRQADELDRGASALLVDRDGFVTETASGNLFVVRGRKLLTPRRQGTLRGISQAYLTDLASDQNLETTEVNLTADDVLLADEAFLTSSVYCMLPVVRLNRCGIGGGRPGATYRMLLAAWSKRVGVDIAAQMSQ
jgi:branched-subunit amino acid aminotransferase/4-amino-4-deoxychorismate lyase